VALIPLFDGGVHLWLLPRDEGKLQFHCRTGLSLLSSAERERLDRLVNPRLARQFLLGRVLMRRGLAAHLEVDPSKLVIAPEPLGMPRLLEPSVPDLAFNLAHTRSDWVLAVARGERLGVDLERIDRASSAHRIAMQFYSDAEKQEISRQEDQAAHALMLWTLKECVVKAMGRSLWEGLGGVRFGIDAGRIEWLAPPPEGDEACWSVVLGCLRDDHWLALALKSSHPPRPDLAISCHVLDDRPGSQAPFRLHFSSRVA
jgi:phosphopantetheinyl transferase